MSNINIFKLLYNNSPMDFYTFTNDNKTIIKSVNDTSLGYEFNKKFKTIDIDKTWHITRAHKRISTILIVLAFVGILYGLIFPNFWQFIDNNAALNILGILLIIGIIYFTITVLSTKCFEYFMKKIFGDFTKTKFISSEGMNEEYFHLFKLELAKVAIVLICIGLFISVGSPIKLAHKYIKEGKYKNTIKITSVGAIAFPILPEWYALRGYARFQLEDYKGAINDYDKAYKLEADNKNATSFDNKIYIKYYTNDYESALLDFDNEITNASNEYEKDAFLWDKAQFLYHINEYEKALSIYSELLSKADGDRIFLLKDRLYLEKAQIYQNLGLEDLMEENLIKAGTLDLSNSQINAIPKLVLILEDI